MAAAAGAAAGLIGLGVQHISVMARDQAKAAPLLSVGRALGAEIDWVQLGTPVPGLDVAVSTLPADVAVHHGNAIATVPVLLDAIYDPWPTPLAAAVRAAGGTVISGLQMLLHQAYTQVEMFTGLPAPRDAMTCAVAGLD